MKNIFLFFICLFFLAPSQSYSQKFVDNANSQTPSKSSLEKNEKRESRHERWWRDLGLTEDQKSKLRELKDNKREEVRALRDEIERKNEELKLIMAGNDKADKARKVHKRIQEIKAELGNIHFESMLAIREMLTPEQRKNFVEHMKLREKKHHGSRRGDD